MHKLEQLRLEVDARRRQVHKRYLATLQQLTDSEQARGYVSRLVSIWGATQAPSRCVVMSAWGSRRGLVLVGFVCLGPLLHLAGRF